MGKEVVLLAQPICLGNTEWALESAPDNLSCASMAKSLDPRSMYPKSGISCPITSYVTKGPNYKIEAISIYSL